MGFFEIFGFCVSVLGMYGVVVCLRCLLPCHIIPNVSAMLNDAQDTLTRAVTAGAIPDISEHGLDLERYRIPVLPPSGVVFSVVYTASRASLRGCVFRAIVLPGYSNRFGLLFNIVSPTGFIPSHRKSALSD